MHSLFISSLRKGAATAMAAVIALTFLYTPLPVALGAGANLIDNPGLETERAGGLPDGWFRGQWGDNTAVFTYPVTGRGGTKAARVDMTERVSGDAKWYFATVSTDGGTYHFSNHYRSDTETILTAEFRHSDGSFSYRDIGFLPSAEEWTKASAEVLVPDGVESFTVFHLINQPGWLEVDDYELTAPAVSGACPIEPREGVIIIDNFEKRLRADLGKPYEHEVVAVAIPAGEYRVTLVTEDHYDGRAAILQENESWYAQLLAGGDILATTTATTDIEDGVDAATSTDVVAHNLSLPVAADTLVAQHAADIDHSAPNSLNPVCAVFEDLESDGGNLILNPGMDVSTASSTPTYWGRGRWGDNTAIFSYIPAHSDRGGRVEITEWVSGDAKWHFTHVPTTPGVTYAFSDWYRSSTSTYLTAQYQNTDGTYQYEDLELLPSATSWTKAETTFTPPAGTISTTVFHLINTVGWLETDTYFLAEE